MTAEVTLGDVALPHGTPERGGDRAWVRPRARARVPVAERDGNVVAMPGVTVPQGDTAGAAVRTKDTRVVLWSDIKDAAGEFRADLGAAWPWRDVPPSLRQLWAQRIPARDRAPGKCDTAGSTALWWMWIGWNHVALLITLIGYALIWTQQHPVRALPTDITLIALIGMLLH